MEEKRAALGAASVFSLHNPAQTVAWSIVETGAADGTSVSDSGLLSVSENEILTTLTVKSTSTVDTNESGAAAITLKRRA
ncbi:MAG: hypothetical protein LBG43_00675 [Treponema sp.]|nr:hypothetical protein [Treponema sp.]